MANCARQKEIEKATPTAVSRARAYPKAELALNTAARWSLARENENRDANPTLLRRDGIDEHRSQTRPPVSGFAGETKFRPSDARHIDVLGALQDAESDQRCLAREIRIWPISCPRSSTWFN